MISDHVITIVMVFLMVFFFIGASESKNELQASEEQLNMTVNNSAAAAMLPQDQDSNETNVAIDGRGYPAGSLQIPYTGLVRNQISPEIAKSLGLNSTTFGMIVA